MKTELQLKIQAQPDDVTCGPACLYSIYRYFGDEAVSLRQVIEQIDRLDHGGTLIEALACHALRRGFRATIYTYHVDMFDPTWFAQDGGVHSPEDVGDRLTQQIRARKADHRTRLATRAMREFLSLGGELRMQDLVATLIAAPIRRGLPIIAGLSSTFLYRESRLGRDNKDDDIGGDPQGHFVMIIGYDGRRREVLVADPLDKNPPFHTARYRLSIGRFINAVLLGILTHDANLLVVEPRTPRRHKRRRPPEPG